MHKVYAPQFRRVVWFSAKCSEINCLRDIGQCTNTAIKYSLFCSWQLNYFKTKLIGMHRIPYFRIRPDPDPDPVHL